VDEKLKIPRIGNENIPCFDLFNLMRGTNIYITKAISAVAVS
jgi:hypothetical protein